MSKFHGWMQSTAYVEGKVAIIDAMAIVQGIKKTPTMKKMSDFRLVFCKKIQRRAKNYSDSRVLLDEYLDQSLKENTRVKRAKDKGKKAVVQMHYQINENMSLAAVPLKELLSSTKTKRSLTKFLADGLLSQFEGNLIVVQGCMTREAISAQFHQTWQLILMKKLTLSFLFTCWMHFVITQ